MPGKRSGGRHSKQRETPKWLRIGLTGLALAIVILVAGVLANLRGNVPTPVATNTAAPTITASPTVPATSTAIATTIVPATSTAAATGTATLPGQSASLPADAFTRPIADLTSLLPIAVAGYTVGNVETSTASAIVPLEPTNAGPLGKVTIVVLTVFDKKSDAAARTYVDQFQRAYSKDLSTITVGTLAGRFGTDGSHLAAIVFSRGRYAFEIVATATRGAPIDLKPIVLQAAQAFGATRTAL